MTAKKTRLSFKKHMKSNYHKKHFNHILGSETVEYAPEQIKGLLEQLGYKLIDSNGWFKTNALYRGGQNKSALSINKKTGRFVDFAASTAGSLKDLICLTMGSDDAEVTQLLEKLEKNIIYDKFRNYFEITEPKYYSEQVLDNLLWEPKYFESRGITQHTQKRFRLGLATKNRMADRYVFHVRDEKNKIIGFCGRKKEDSPQKNAPKYKIVGPKRDFLFPNDCQDAIISRGSVILVESPVDVLSLYEAGIENCMALFGVKIFSKQIEMLLRSNPKTIFVSLNKDGDHNAYAGETGAKEVCRALKGFFNNVEIVFPPRNDWNEVLVADGKQAIREFWKEKLEMKEENV